MFPPLDDIEKMQRVLSGRCIDCGQPKGYCVFLRPSYVREMVSRHIMSAEELGETQYYGEDIGGDTFHKRR
jgi:hypothetical protein